MIFHSQNRCLAYLVKYPALDEQIWFLVATMFPVSGEVLRYQGSNVDHAGELIFVLRREGPGFQS